MSVLFRFRWQSITVDFPNNQTTIHTSTYKENAEKNYCNVEN